MIYIGHYRSDMVLAIDRFPELITMCEKDMRLWGKDNWQLLHGYWINNLQLLGHIPPEEIGVIAKDGYCAPLNTHPKWKQWEMEFSPMEFYSMVGYDWVKNN